MECWGRVVAVFFTKMNKNKPEYKIYGTNFKSTLILIIWLMSRN